VSSLQPSHTTRDDFRSAPIPDENILEGEPVARSCDLSQSPDGGLSMNLWDCSAGRFRWNYYGDELVNILEGEVRVTDENGDLTVLRAGSTAHFNAGDETIWEVPEYVRKLAIHRTPQSLPARISRKLSVMAKQNRRRRSQASAPVLRGI